MRHLHVCVALASLLITSLAPRAQADPLDETYRSTFYITPIGGWSGGEDALPDYLTRMLQNVGGTQPKQIKVGFSLPSTFFMVRTQGAYYDFFPDPFYGGGDMDAYIELARQHNAVVGTHVNGMPWGDTDQQSADVLHNYLEKLDGGAWLQKDRNGFIRRSDLPQDPTINEQGDAFAPYLEMQLSLSRYATPVQQWVGQSTRISMRYWRWYQEQHPDLVVFASGSSEYRMNGDANGEFCDYSDASKQEFRDWLRGAGLYAGQGQYADLNALNSDGNVNGASGGGFPFASWEVVVPPTNVNWSFINDTGRWWRKFHAFRVNQVQQMAQQQMIWSAEVGLSPDRIFTHQTNEDPNSTGFITGTLAAPYTTSFSRASSNGITTYGSTAADATLFGAVRDNDRNWGIFEYNRLVPANANPQPSDVPSASDISTNLSALNAAFTNGAHILTPYVWYGQGQYQIKYTAFEEALKQFVVNRQNDRFSGLALYEATPESRNVIWAMGESDDVESASGLTGVSFAAGTFRATIGTADPFIHLELNEAAHRIDGNQFSAVSLRMNLGQAAPAAAQLTWFDEDNTPQTVDFTAQPGWRVYRINLAADARWRDHQMQGLRLDPSAVAGGNVELDWVQLHADHAWPFDDANEIYGSANITGLTVAGGKVTGTDSNGDGFFYLSTDKRSPVEHADRVFVDADQLKTLRVRITASAAGSAQLYWWKDAGGPFYTPFPVAAGTQTYVVDLSAMPDWNGRVTQIRLDPVNTAGVAFEVDALGLATRLQPPRVASTDPIHNTPAPVLRWERASEADGTALTTDLQLDDDFAFGSPAVNETGLAGEMLTPDASALDGLHWWRIRSRRGSEVSPWTPPFPIYLRRWQFNRLADVQVSNHLATGTISGGVWQTQATGGDPFFYVNAGGNGLGRGINASEYGRLRLRMRATGGVNAGGELFFFPRSGGFVNLPAHLPQDGTWATREYDLSATPQWTGYMHNLRVDPPGASGAQYEVDFAELLPTAPSVNPVWEFNTAGDFEWWSPNVQTLNPRVSGGAFAYTVAGSDANLVSPAVNFAAASRPWLRVRLRNQSAGTSAQFYWATPAQPTFDGTRVISFAISANDAGVKEYFVDLRTAPTWTGTISRLRLDPVAVASGTITIDSISVQASAPGNSARGWTAY